MTKDQALRLIRDNPYKIGHWTGFRDLTELHNEWLRDFLFRKDDQTKLAHRGSYKTTDLSLFLAIHAMIAPNETVLFFRKTDADVTEVITQTRKIMQSEALREMSRVIYGEPMELLRINSGEIQTNLTTSLKGSAQITGLGIGTSITGKHADIVVTDDIVNVKDRVSKAERDRTKLAYMELQNIKNRGGRFINTGTPWHKDDAISALMPNVERFDCYHTGLISQEEMKELQASMSPSLFAANYELRHIADDDALFRDVAYGGTEADLYGGRSHIDAAYGGDDWTAYTVMKERTDGKIDAFGKVWHKHVDDVIDEIEGLQEMYRVGSISCETNGDKGYLAKELRKRGLIVDSYAEKMNKHLKIATYLRRAWPRIEWIDTTDPEYMAQILDYTEDAEHDDAPDSAACLVRKLEKRLTLNTIHGGL